jgi:hypothetical protein
LGVDIIFNVVDMLYLYNGIFRRGLLNTFEAALHSVYICLKVPATFAYWLKPRPPIKKEATPKCKRLKSKTSDEKRGNPKTKGA